MGEVTGIEWAYHTFNPWVGCTKVSPACDNCYAETWAKRAGHPELWQGKRRRTSAANWQQPIKWNRAAQQSGVRKRVFCASLADVFDNRVPVSWRRDLWHRIEQTPWLDWLLLTKRPQNIATMLPDPETGVKPWRNGWPNVWLGTTAENQTDADRRIPHLLDVPARVHFVSYEPALGPVDFTRINKHPPKRSGWFDVLAGREHIGPAVVTGQPKINWIICGGESGPHARPMDLAWSRSVRDQCRDTRTAFFMKQIGGKKKPFPDIPDDLMIREFPDTKGTNNVRS